METVNKRLDSFAAALNTLEEILQHEPSVIVRDATIQRFEYTTESAWKALKHFLLVQEGLECATPKSCIRTALQAGILNEEETELFLCLIDDRNLTSHTYVEAVAEKIASSIPAYAKLLRHLYDSMIAAT